MSSGLATEISVGKSTTQELVSFIVPTRNNRALLENLLNSLSATLTNVSVSTELLVADNGSDHPETLDYLAQLPNHRGTHTRCVVISCPGPFNYSAINNRAARHANGQWLCLLNDDIEAITPAWLDRMLEEARQTNTGCVGAKLLYPDETIQHAGVALGLGGVAGHVYKHAARNARGIDDYLVNPQSVTAVTGACLLISRTLFTALDGFDEELAVAWNDVDLCLRARARGHTNRWTPHAELYHHESKSRGKSHQRSSADRRRLANESRYMHAKWRDELALDPCLHNRLPANLLGKPDRSPLSTRLHQHWKNFLGQFASD